MLVASLVPSATEMLFALGLGDSVAGVTHECDYPPGAERLPHLTRSVIGEGLSAREIDEAVRERTGRGEALYELDEDTLAELDVDLIVTQAVCAVCAVSFDDVKAVAERLPTRPDVISLDPSTLGEVLADLPRLAEAAGDPDAGERLVADAAARIEAVERAVARRPASARGRARMARPGVRRAATGCRRWCSWPEARTCSACPVRSRARWSGPRWPPCLPRWWSRCPAGCMPRRRRPRRFATASGSQSSARAWWPWTPRPTTPARARASWTAWSSGAPAAPRSRARTGVAALDRDRPRASPGRVTVRRARQAPQPRHRDRRRPPRARPAGTRPYAARTSARASARARP